MVKCEWCGNKIELVNGVWVDEMGDDRCLETNDGHSPEPETYDEGRS